MPKPRNSWAQGRAAGYNVGWSEGHHYGVCQAITAKHAETEGVLFDLHVAYIEEAMFGVNDGIIESLSGLVTRFSRCLPYDNPVAKIAQLRPDLVLVLNGIHLIGPPVVDAIRALGIPVAVWFVDDPYFTDKSAAIARHFDYVFTHEISCVPFYRKLGCQHVHHLPLAASRNIFHPRQVPIHFRKEISFIGTGFWNRIRTFDQIAPYLARKNSFLAGGLWRRLRHYRKLAPKIAAWTDLAETVNYYAGSKIVINIHRSHDDALHNRNSRRLPGLSVNPRTFEIAACGTLQITDIRSDLTNFYTPGHDIETFSTPGELIAKIEHYLRYEDQRRAIAARALHRTLAEHSYRRRLYTLLVTTMGTGSLLSNKRNRSAAPPVAEEGLRSGGASWEERPGPVPSGDTGAGDQTLGREEHEQQTGHQN
ncbi:glycosyltransferase [Paenibacillus sp. MBLB4367]|uniref:CgeB family protein n=1 Tax=Paenibacillus sp. MBLB4367 TaxID=3384767 RepID=UPI0039080E32